MDIWISRKVWLLYVIFIIVITLFQVGAILANANKNQLTDIKTFFKEKKSK